MWVFMYNMPGCLPEMEPESHYDFENARQSMIAEFSDELDNAHAREDEYGTSDGDKVRETVEWADCLNRAMCAGSEYDLVLTAPNGYVYSVTYDPEASDE